MPSCKQKINAQSDQIFNYLSDFQNIIELYKDKVPIKTVNDLGSACYGKKYRYEVESNAASKYKKQAFTVEITQYEPYESIAWCILFDRRTEEHKDTIYLPSTFHMTCKLKAKDEYTLVLLDFYFEMQASWWVKVLFHTAIRMFQHRICQVLVNIRKDIEQKYV